MKSFVKTGADRAQQIVDKTAVLALPVATALMPLSARAGGGGDDSYTAAFTTIATVVAAIGAAGVAIAVAWVTASTIIRGIKRFGK